MKHIFKLAAMVVFLIFGCNIQLSYFSIAHDNTLPAASVDKGMVKGRVIDANDAGVIGASVWLSNGQKIGKQVLTNKSGEYSFTDLKPGLYSLLVIAKGFQRYEAGPAFEVAPGQTKAFDIQLMVKSGKEAAVVETGILKGRVIDANNAGIVGASVWLISEERVGLPFVTDRNGEFSFTDLKPGLYSIRVIARGFQSYDVESSIKIDPRKTLAFDIQLMVKSVEEVVSIGSESQHTSGLNTRILREEDLQKLPDTPGGFQAVLRALTLRGTDPQGPQIIVDGFSGGRLPPKDSIREIRINDNPFSAEYSQMGLGRVEIFTKPGMDKFHANAFSSFNDESLNSRNPYSQNRSPFQSRIYGGNVSGPIVKGRSSFFMDTERLETDDNALINASIISPAFDIISFNKSLTVPFRQLSLSPRLDFQINRNNTLVGRYFYISNQKYGDNVGGFSLPERAVDSTLLEHGIKLTETSVINSIGAVNETRFQYIHRRNIQLGNNSMPMIDVPEAFNGGGSNLGKSQRSEDFAEIQNHTILSRGNHDLKFGGKFRFTNIVDYATDNFGGTFTFSGGNAPLINNNGQITVNPANGLPQTVSITGIERYRRTLLLRELGFSPENIRALGGGATQFSIAGGQPKAKVRQYGIEGYVQDDWRLRPNFTLSTGLRFETQNNISSNLNLAPRFSFAWAPDANSSNPKTVIRGGFGIFHDQFSEDYTLEAKRYNGSSQQQFFVSDPAVLDRYPLGPSASSLAAFALPQTIRRVAGDLQVPFSTQLSLSLERQLPRGFSVAATFVKTNMYRSLRSRNINAPLVPGDIKTRPLPEVGELFEYESSGRFNQDQLIANTVYNGKKLNFYMTYLLTRAKSDTEGAGSFPSNQYDLNGEYGRSSLGIRHQFYFGGWISAPWGINLNPLVFFRSGMPFNIITGRDTNNDQLFTERPAFATDLNRGSVVSTPLGAFDLDPVPGQQIVPRNFGLGPNFLSVNLGISKTITLFGNKGESKKDSAASSPQRPLSMTFSLQFENCLNRTNPGLPVGNLSSPLFARSYVPAGAYGLGSNSGGNRKIEAQISFNF